MPNLFNKDEAVTKAPPVVGYEIARFLKSTKKDRVSVFDVVDHFKKEPWFSSNSFFYGITFLYSVGLIDFDEPYLITRHAD